jgi:hypothetical protein
MRRWIMVGLWGLLSASTVSGATTYNFEDGQLRGDPTSMRVAPRIIQEGSNHFMRITGSRGDCESLPDALCPPRNRSTVKMTQHWHDMPGVTPANRTQSYRVKMRPNVAHGVIFELFQGGDGGEGGYGNRNGTGPVVIFVRNGHNIWGRANYANETQATEWNCGSVPSGSWITLGIDAVWSHDPGVGRIEAFCGGRSVRTITGRSVMLGEGSNRLPMLKVGMYGDNATGQVDVDDIQVGAGAGGGGPVDPPVVIRLQPPTNFRVEQR